jgi:hypothetical protein
MTGDAARRCSDHRRALRRLHPPQTLDRLLTINQRHAAAVLRQYEQHYNEDATASASTNIGWHDVRPVSGTDRRGATPRASRRIRRPKAWHGPRRHRGVDQCCGTMVGPSGRRVAGDGACRAVVDELDRERRPGSGSSLSCPTGRWCAVGSSIYRSQVLPQRCCQLLQLAPAPLRWAAGSATRQPVGRMDMGTLRTACSAT